MFPSLGFAVVLVALLVALQGDLVIANELLMMMVPSIPWLLLIEPWAEFASLGHNGG